MEDPLSLKLAIIKLFHGCEGGWRTFILLRIFAAKVHQISSISLQSTWHNRIQTIFTEIIFAYIPIEQFILHGPWHTTQIGFKFE